MRLLILTQKVNKNDDVLGFFHGWILEFAKHCKKITVICLENGEYNLPEKVRVLSLGKEKGRSRLKYIWRFYKYILAERKNYDNVFVHMNQEYMLLGGILWRFLGKKAVLWRNHAKGGILTKIAVFLSNKVMYTSPQSFTAQFKKAQKMPVGIDTERFKNLTPNQNKFGSGQEFQILSLGRISPVKRLEILVEAMNKLDNVVLNIVGAPTEKDRGYYDKLRRKAEENINFLGSVSNEKTAEVYNSHDLFVNLTPSGSFDKTIFEAMACESLVLVVNDLVVEPKELSEKIKAMLNLSGEEKEKQRKENREYVIKNHDLKKLVHEIIKTFQSIS